MSTPLSIRGPISRHSSGKAGLSVTISGVMPVRAILNRSKRRSGFTRVYYSTAMPMALMRSLV